MNFEFSVKFYIDLSMMLVIIVVILWKFMFFSVVVEFMLVKRLSEQVIVNFVQLCSSGVKLCRCLLEQVSLLLSMKLKVIVIIVVMLLVMLNVVFFDQWLQMKCLFMIRFCIVYSMVSCMMMFIVLMVLNSVKWVGMIWLSQWLQRLIRNLKVIVWFNLFFFLVCVVKVSGNFLMCRVVFMVVMMLSRILKLILER